jgi:predicted secreted Zn-dependent protease
VDRASDTQRGLVECREGPDGEVLVARYGMEVAAGDLRRLQRLESEFGHERVQRWADEGIPVGTMGKPRDMEAYRERKADDASEGEDGPRRGEPSSGNDLAEPVQPTLRVSSPDDPAEREAEAVAERVIEMDTPANADAGREEEAGATVYDDRFGRVVPTVPAHRASRSTIPEGTGAAVRNAISGEGKPLPARTREEFESKMGADFSDVRVHTGMAADGATRSINAEAYTMGTDIAFADGNYAPHSRGGKELLAHELTHVVQQSQRVRARIQRQFSGSDDSGNQSGSNEEAAPTIDRNWVPSGWEEQTYDVSGESCEELRQQILKQDVSCDDGKNVGQNRAAATCFGARCQLSNVLFTIPQPNENISTQEIEGEDKVEVTVDEVTIADFDFSLSFTRKVIMPRWEGLEDADTNFRSKWVSFVTALQEHERAHIELAEQKYLEIEKTLKQHVESVPEDVTSVVRDELDGMVVKKEEGESTPEKVTAELGDEISNLSTGVGSEKLEAYVEEERHKQIEQLAKAQEKLHKRIGEKESFTCD